MSSTTTEAKQSLAEILSAYTQKITLRMFFLGFSAGLPLLLVLGTLGFWLREAGIDRSTIGYLSWIGLIYGLKWVWAPLVDRLTLPLLSNWLGRRKAWLLIAQVLVMIGLVGMSMSDPSQQVNAVAWFAVLVAFGSATQDIALDAFRIESADTKMQGVLAAAYQTGYRFAMIWAGAGVLWIAARAQNTPDNVYDHYGWQIAYLCMAASMLVGVITVLISKEKPFVPKTDVHSVKQWIHVAFIEPFADFLKRYQWHAVLILSLIAVYRISDVVMGIMANPFYVDMGYTKDEVASVTKIFGVIMTLLGAFIGGGLTVRFGIFRILMLGAILSAASNLLFAWLATRGHDLSGLIFVISADNLSSGIASAAFIAYLSSLTNVSYSATQYALFSSMMLLIPKWMAGFSGVFVDHFGYSTFFISTAIIGLPVLILVWFVSKLNLIQNSDQAENSVKSQS
ncbi:MFS transporter [Polynucleobacter sp. SHI8]|uniref:AmpG family muropeptide MFS transporter n=1 Tax=unclassified Polynucleobacter TaxID=2640945 RepID=UPI00248F5CE2|nr:MULTISPECIES: MFS transporter [unclassified Polynucleobacter]BDW12222.1 MFS transporter [Polynucleobacter sp. SHI2]BDW14670.1 MFS transporter [Polynucleobacter sp. SHI8]